MKNKRVSFNCQFSVQKLISVSPNFQKQNSKTLLFIYIDGVTILYNNIMHKLKTERS